MNLTVLDGKNPCQLKMSDLKVAAARNGCSPIGSQDEMLTELVAALKKSKPSKQADILADSKSIRSNEVVTEIDAISLARRVLELDEMDDWVGILNLAANSTSGKISRQSPTNIMRKAYLKLSLLIHPDKLGYHFIPLLEATFQNVPNICFY